MLEQVVVLSRRVPRLLLKRFCCLLLYIGTYGLMGDAVAASSITCKCGGQRYQGVCPAGQTALRCDCKGMAVLCQAQASKAPAAKAKAVGKGGKQAKKASAKTAQKGASKPGQKANASNKKAAQKKGKKPRQQQARKSKQKAAAKSAAKPAGKPAE